MGTVILWMTLYSYEAGKYLQVERFSSKEACESFVENFRVSAGEKPQYKGHFCFQDF